MPLSMFQSSAPIFVQHLLALSAILDKAQAFADAKKVEANVLLDQRLYPDMFPLVRQVRSTCDHAMRACGLLAGKELPTFSNDEATIAQLKDRIAKVIDFIKGIKASQVDGTESKEVTVKFPTGERKFVGQPFLLGFCLPNFYFHLTIAYGILRSIGVEVGKRDFMGTLVTL
ncbi:MAG: DUF1993 domain-containing protein [Alphaproteobacteria bacterium]|nr:DUF1993 domain-containing protein [Alphaproteobacteria bacterium]